jgi:fumarate hydratase subunit alpha
MRAIHSDEITKNVREMCIQANLILSDDIKSRILSAGEIETSPLGKRILGQLKENLEIAKNDQIPICQDTGMAVVFLNIGQDVHIEGALVEDAVNEGIRQGYRDGYLRKSVVSDPILRENTKDNTPGIIHYSIVQGENLEIIVAPKGFGSENMSRTIMLKPADGIEGIRRAVVETVMLAGPNACPPIVVGVGIGGDFEKSAILAKKALTRDLNIPSSLPHIKNLEEELLKEINETSIGPGGLGGKITALGVNIETYPTHIAGLPVAVNICCHVNRHVKRII